MHPPPEKIVDPPLLSAQTVAARPDTVNAQPNPTETVRPVRLC